MACCNCNIPLCNKPCKDLPSLLNKSTESFDRISYRFIYLEADIVTFEDVTATISN